MPYDAQNAFNYEDCTDNKMSTEDFKRLLIEETSIIKQMDMFNQAIWDIQTICTLFLSRSSLISVHTIDCKIFINPTYHKIKNQFQVKLNFLAFSINSLFFQV